MKTDFDLAIVGSGFAGSLLAMVARRLGLTVALLERGTHPRFAIGESTSPLMNLMLEQMAERYDLPRLLPLASYGTWQETYPEITCGLKRGFSYYHHTAGQPFQRDPGRQNELLVSASPNDRLADTHWFRADVDAFLVQEAIATGAEYLDRVCLNRVEVGESGGTVTGEREGRSLSLSFRLLVDATGPRGFLSRQLGLAEIAPPHYPGRQSLFTHFTGVRRTGTMHTFADTEATPYPPDDAALHHVFEGGWMWVLRFNNGVTSAGFALNDGLANELRLSEGGTAAWGRFLARFPTIREQFAEAEPVRPFIYSPRLPYRCSEVTGPGWVLLPSATAFIDPLFSTGMPLALLGIERLGRIFAEHWKQDTFVTQLEEYGRITLQEVDGAARFIAGCYAGMSRFPLFASYAMFYFAAASYAEMARRLQVPHRVQRYLAADRGDFAPHLARLAEQLFCGAADIEPEPFAAEVRESIARLNIAGLANPAKRNRYGVDLEDVVQGAAKLGFTPQQMRNILATAPWAQL